MRCLKVKYVLVVTTVLFYGIAPTIEALISPFTLDWTQLKSRKSSRSVEVMRLIQLLANEDA